MAVDDEMAEEDRAEEDTADEETAEEETAEEETCGAVGGAVPSTPLSSHRQHTSTTTHHSHTITGRAAHTDETLID